MRRWMLPVIGLLLATRPAPGQAKYPADAFITSPEVEVRSFPSEKSYATSKLRRGERVKVVKEFKDNPEWLEIEPPPGSFSWINEKALNRFDPYHPSVRENDTGIRPGSAISNEPPNVEKVKLKAGTIVAVIGQPMKTKEGDTFLPIRPHLTEVRYIPAVAVKTQSVVQNQTPVAPNPSSNVYLLSNPLLQQAEAAYQARDYERAKLLFKAVCDDKASTFDQKSLAYNRISTMSGPPNSWQPGPGNVAGQTMSATRPPSTSQYSSAAAPSPISFSPQWSGYGRLRPTSYQKDGLPRYVLEDDRFNPVLYVSPAPGLSLSAFVGRRVALFGPITYNSEARTNHMTATHVAMP